MTLATTLDPISPEDATEWYLDHKGQEVTQDTVECYRTALGYFVEYCESRDIANLNDLTGRDVERYRIWRREDSTDDQLEPKTMRDQMYLLRDFLRYLESIEGVRRDLHAQVVIPKLGPDDGVRNIKLGRDRARRILSYLEKFEYASLDHVVWLLLCETGRRIGGLRSLDVDDYYPESDYPYLAFRHRPERGTRLKNGTRGERNVTVTEDVCEILEDHLENKRPHVTDDYGRRPLLATTNGRLSTSTMRKYVYKWTRPCHVSGECPHDRVVSDCEAAQAAHEASKCPSSVSPHAIRHGYISSMLDAETPKPVLSERCDVSESVIDKHYDERSESEKQNLRGRVLDRINQNSRGGYAE